MVWCFSVYLGGGGVEGLVLGVVVAFYFCLQRRFGSNIHLGRVWVLLCDREGWNRLSL